MKDGVMGPRTEFAVRTFTWTTEELKAALYAAEQETQRLRNSMLKISELLQSSANKLQKKADN